ncbi:TonB family protein [Zunongwangia sp. F363]|uniref:TonB family protein n=1 Tax=Autumnicola tepida TaxID=3075595 RepID=A0ABU3C565_9FLAO|nr:TonB family protein [Zunongwangia sp. F363]MDT0641483.1 TonB family protein [Zunongwangia sp. F363]
MKNLLVIACMFVGGLCMAQDQTSPVWPGCEGSDNVKKCFNQKFSQFVRSTYEYPKNDKGEYVRGKVTVSFTVNKEGEVVVNSVEGPEPEVNQAAREMLEKMPKMEPGTLGGEVDDRKFTNTFKF